MTSKLSKLLGKLPTTAGGTANTNDTHHGTISTTSSVQVPTTINPNTTQPLQQTEQPRRASISVSTTTYGNQGASRQQQQQHINNSSTNVSREIVFDHSAEPFGHSSPIHGGGGAYDDEESLATARMIPSSHSSAASSTSSTVSSDGSNHGGSGRRSSDDSGGGEDDMSNPNFYAPPSISDTSSCGSPMYINTQQPSPDKTQHGSASRRGRGLSTGGGNGGYASCGTANAATDVNTSVGNVTSSSSANTSSSVGTAFGNNSGGGVGYRTGSGSSSPHFPATTAASSGSASSSPARGSAYYHNNNNNYVGSILPPASGSGGSLIAAGLVNSAPHSRSSSTASHNSAASSPKQSLLFSQTPPRRLFPGSAHHHPRSTSTGAAASSDINNTNSNTNNNTYNGSNNVDGGVGVSGGSTHHRRINSNGMGYDEEVAEITNNAARGGGVGGGGAAGQQNAANPLPPRSTGFRHSRKSSSPSLDATFTNSNNNNSATNNTTAVYIDPLDITDTFGTKAEESPTRGGAVVGLPSATNGATTSPFHGGGFSARTMPQSLRGSIMGGGGGMFSDSLTNQNISSSNPFSAPASSATFVSYEEFCENIAMIPKLFKEGEETAHHNDDDDDDDDADGPLKFNNTGSTKSDRSATHVGATSSGGGVGPASFVEPPMKGRHNDGDDGEEAKGDESQQSGGGGGGVTVLYSSPFGDDEEGAATNAATAPVGGGGPLPSHDPTAFDHHTAVNTSLVTSDEDVTSSSSGPAHNNHRNGIEANSEESNATAFLRRPLTDYCRPDVACNPMPPPSSSTTLLLSSARISRTFSANTNNTTISPSCTPLDGGGALASPPTASASSNAAAAIAAAQPSTYGLHQHYLHRPLPPAPPVTAMTPQRTPRPTGAPPLFEGGCAATAPEGTIHEDDGEHGDFDGIPEGLLATEGTALSASFSLAPTFVTTPADADNNNTILPSPGSGVLSPTRSADGSNGPLLAASVLGSSSSPPADDRKPAIITCIDLVAYHGTMSMVIGDVHGRVDLLEAREPRTVLPNVGALFSRKHQMMGASGRGDRGSVMSLAGTMRGGFDRSSMFGGGGPATDVSDTASNATATPSNTTTSRSPANGMSPSNHNNNNSNQQQHTNNNTNGNTTPSAVSLSAVIGDTTNTITAGFRSMQSNGRCSPSANSVAPPMYHTRHNSFESERDMNSNVRGSLCGGGPLNSARGVMNRTPHGYATPSPVSPISARPSKFTKKCSHQAFVEEFDCRKSNTIDHQLRCVRFLPANQAPGVTSYLAANEKTIKLFRIRGEQFQHANNGQHNHLIHVRRRNSGAVGIHSNNFGGGGCAPAGSPNSISGAASDNGVFASNGDIFPVTPRQRFNKRIIMPVKAFTNVHQYNIQSLSLSADCETFLSLDDLQVFWWHLEAQDTTKATKLADLKPESGQPDILLTAAAFHPQNGSLFLVSNSNGVCEIGDLRDPPCRKQRSYKISLQVKPELHNTVFHDEHNDILSAISAASFMGKDFVVTRDYLSLKMWDMRYPTNPVASCPVMDFLEPTMDFLYDKDYIFDRFPLAVDDQSLTVATGLYAGTVAVWRPGREASNDPNSSSHSRRGVRHGSGAGSGSPSGHHHHHANGAASDYAFDEVEFFSASESVRVPDEYGLNAQIAVGQTSLNDVVKRIVIGKEADDDEEPPAKETDSYGSPIDDDEDEDDEPVYPRVRAMAQANRVTNVAISQGGDRVAFTTNDHLFTFTRR